MKKKGGTGLLLFGVGVLAFVWCGRHLVLQETLQKDPGATYKFNEIGYIILAVSFVMIVIGIIKIAFGEDNS